MRMVSFISLAALALSACGETAPSPAPETELSELERGAIVFKKCRSCHTLGEGEPHRVGPNLWQIFGRTAGSREDFTYSKAMTASDVVWNEAIMDAYLQKPADFMPGGRMSFVGLKYGEDRADVIAYLRAQTEPQ